MNKILLILLTSALLFACNSDKEAENKHKNASTKKAAKCYFSVNKEEVKFQWTAFKTTDKIAVKGTFDAFEIRNDKKEVNITDLLRDSDIHFELPSINSGNKARDEKLMKFFFGNLLNTEHISANVKQIDGSNFEGEAFIALAMNDVEDIVEMTYKLENDLLIFNGDVDLLNWKTDKSLKALNNACKDLHKGKDGVSKTWTTVHIEVIVPLTIDCK